MTFLRHYPPFKNYLFVLRACACFDAVVLTAQLQSQLSATPSWGLGIEL